MTAASTTTLHPLKRNAAQFAVFMGDDSGAFPQGVADITTALLPSSCQLGCGATGIDAITFEVDLYASGWRMQDVQTPIGHQRIVELRRIKSNGDIGDLVCWGKLEAQRQRLNGTNETLQFTASPRSLLRGEGFGTVPHFDGIKNQIIDAHEGWVFNPQVDDLTEGNRSSHQQADHFAFCFAHPESFRTKGAQQAQAANSGTRHPWTISQAVYRVCWSNNPDQTWFDNPTMNDLDQAIDSGSDALFRNVKIALDATLPEALDAILKPCGYTWHLSYSGGLGDVTTMIKVIRLGHGAETDLFLQRLGENLDGNKTNAAELDLQWDIVAKPNVIVGYSAPTLIENTWTLTPAWENSYNNFSWEQINSIDVPREVGRKWVVNEAGDVNHLQSEIDSDGNLLHLSTIKHLARRRKLLPCLTLDPDMQATGANGFVLWCQQTAEGDEVVAQFGFSVLEHEMGIMIEGTLPYWLWTRAQAGGASMSLTATIEIEHRVTFRADRRDKSPNGDEVVMPVDLSHKFGRKLVEGGDSGSSRNYWARHAHLLEVVAGTAGNATFKFHREVEDDLKEGYRIAVLSRNANKLRDDSVKSRFEGTYTVQSVSGDVVTIQEAIETGQAQGTDPIAWCGFNTDESDCLYRLEEYVKQMQAQEDFALLKADVSLAGVDHRSYQRGQLVRSVKPRALSLNAYANDASPRFPQVMAIAMQFNPQQSTTLQLEQMEEGLLR